MRIWAQGDEIQVISEKKKKLIIILWNLFVHDITPFYEITLNQSFIKFVKIEYLGKYNM